jgi:hypothetical protein
MRASGYEVALPQVEVASQERPLKVDLLFSLCDGYCAHLAALQQQGPHLSASCRTYVARPLKQAFKKHLRAVTPATTCSTPPPTDSAPPPLTSVTPCPPPPARLLPLYASHTADAASYATACWHASRLRGGWACVVYTRR